MDREKYRKFNDVQTLTLIYIKIILNYVANLYSQDPSQF